MCVLPQGVIGNSCREGTCPQVPTAQCPAAGKHPQYGGQRGSAFSFPHTMRRCTEFTRSYRILPHLLFHLACADDATVFSKHSATIQCVLRPTGSLAYRSHRNISRTSNRKETAAFGGDMLKVRVSCQGLSYALCSSPYPCEGTNSHVAQV